MLTSTQGRRRPQAPGAQPQGQGLQVPPDSDRVAYPPSLPLLQDRRCPASYLQVRVRHRLHYGRLSAFLIRWVFNLHEMLGHGVGGKEQLAFGAKVIISLRFPPLGSRNLPIEMPMKVS